MIGLKCRNGSGKRPMGHHWPRCRPRVDQYLFVFVLTLVRSSPRSLPPHSLVIEFRHRKPSPPMATFRRAKRPAAFRPAKSSRIVVAFAAAVQQCSRSPSVPTPIRTGTSGTCCNRAAGVGGFRRTQGSPTRREERRGARELQDDHLVRFAKDAPMTTGP